MRKSKFFLANIINKKSVKKYLNRAIFLLFIFINLQLYADKPIVISLGAFCPIAGALRQYQIRTVAYPFDWCVTPFTGLYKIFEEDFNCFLLKENLKIKSDRPSFIEDHYTGCLYNHDFPTIEGSYVAGLEHEEVMFTATVVENFLDYYDKVKEKYLRRIERLKAALNSSEKIVFLRYLITKEEAIALRDLIQTKYPTADFIIIAINYGVPGSLQWNESRIKNYYFDNPWAEKSDEWFYLFYYNDLLP